LNKNLKTLKNVSYYPGKRATEHPLLNDEAIIQERPVRYMQTAAATAREQRRCSIPAGACAAADPQYSEHEKVEKGVFTEQPLPGLTIQPNAI
jgi:hypothetical protein